MTGSSAAINSHPTVKIPPNFPLTPDIASFLSQFEVRRPEATTQRRTRSTASTQQLYPPEWVVDISVVRKELKQFYDTHKSSELVIQRLGPPKHKESKTARQASPPQGASATQEITSPRRVADRPITASSSARLRAGTHPPLLPSLKEMAPNEPEGGGQSSTVQASADQRQPADQHDNRGPQPQDRYRSRSRPSRSRSRCTRPNSSESIERFGPRDLRPVKSQDDVRRRGKHVKAKKASHAAVDESDKGARLWGSDKDNDVYAGPVEVINSVAVTDDSAQLERMTLANNSDTDTEGEVDPDDQMIAEGRVKDEALLAQNGFDPIFIEGKYPGEIPEEIADYLPEDRTKPSWQMVGSNRSIFWIFGYNDIVDVIDDPACLLDDEIVGVPNGVHPASFLFARYANEDKLPRPVLHKYFDGRAPAPTPTTPFVIPAFDIPPLVSDEPTNHQLRNLYPLGRTHDFPSHLLCLRVKSKKKLEKTRDMVQEKLRGAFDFEKDDLWFRGMNLKSLMLSMSFFVPVISTSNSDNEFGPGIYATNDFLEGAKYAQPQGAVMIFKNPDFRDLSVWEPDKDEWNNLTATWLNIHKRNLTISDSHNDADVIKGPISSDQHEARKRGFYPSQSGIPQITCISYDSCRALAKSLVAIIYFHQ
ncbi:hypothetical protein N7519_000555 [Penicillium mononematosum]|uniref:uncharacterized protein n=1 Tax=Penicillium mononematosum TaxID=268346 RepID=UPI002546827D|nr:uncharacterized protein N7519_000555 [Penicillium mononematosum]KAJ6190534.1 hypothetical protein N7519_000555 [Penicillium mononematosum]